MPPAATTTSATTPRNTQRHPTACATYAARAGPNSVGRIHAAEKLQNTAGLRDGGYLRATSTYRHTVTPPPPKP
jgi:hypothetical protein